MDNWREIIRVGMTAMDDTKPRVRVKMGRITVDNRGLRVWDPKDYPEQAAWHEALTTSYNAIRKAK